MDYRRTQSTVFILLACALLIPGAARAAEAHDPLRKVRETFRQAYEQVDAPNPTSRPDSEALRDYPLYPYLQAARIRRALADAGDEPGSVDQRAQTFITYHESEPVGRNLRRVWLTSLAERGHWTQFLEQYRDNLADDALECQSFTARIELDRTSDMMPLVAKRWLTPRSLPDCERAFDWLRTQNALTPELIEQRARMALREGNSGFAREMAAFLPPERAAPLLQWAALLEEPQRQIEALIAAPSTIADNEALLAGWTRFARGQSRSGDEALRHVRACARPHRGDGQSAMHSRWLSHFRGTATRKRCATTIASQPRISMTMRWNGRRAPPSGTATGGGLPMRSLPCRTRSAVSRAGATGRRALRTATATRNSRGSCTNRR